MDVARSQNCTTKGCEENNKNKAISPWNLAIRELQKRINEIKVQGVEDTVKKADNLKMKNE
jgi:hypothetical protein